MFSLFGVCVYRLKDLEMFLEHTRGKFVGFQVKNDHNSLAGLPQPIHEGVKVLKQVSLNYTVDRACVHCQLLFSFPLVVGTPFGLTISL